MTIPSTFLDDLVPGSDPMQDIIRELDYTTSKWKDSAAINKLMDTPKIFI